MYSKMVLDALVEQASDKDVSRMVVIINEFSIYRDYADFHKHDPEWWAELGEKIYTQTPHPKMALAPYIIAAGQYLITETEDTWEEKVIPLISKAMAINPEHSNVQTLAKISMALKVGAIERPTMDDLRKNVLPDLKEAVRKLDEKLEYKE